MKVLISFKEKDHLRGEDSYFGMQVERGYDINHLMNECSQSNIKVIEDEREQIDYLGLLDELILYRGQQHFTREEKDLFLDIVYHFEESDNLTLEEIADCFIHLPQRGGIFGVSEKVHNEYLGEFDRLVQKYYQQEGRLSKKNDHRK